LVLISLTQMNMTQMNIRRRPCGCLPVCTRPNRAQTVGHTLGPHTGQLAEPWARFASLSFMVDGGNADGGQTLARPSGQ
jgi:hypothetical protein